MILERRSLVSVLELVENQIEWWDDTSFAISMKQCKQMESTMAKRISFYPALNEEFVFIFYK